MNDQVQIDEFTMRRNATWRIAQRWESAAYGCRHTVGPGHQQCMQPSVAMLARSRHNYRDRTADIAWWAYCEKHCYGRQFDGTHLWTTVPANAPIVHNATIIRAAP